MVFDIIEFVTLLFALLAFGFITNAYWKSKETEAKQLWMFFLIIAVFILLNRIFTNVEALFFKDFFNLLEHLSIAAAAFTFVYAVVKINKEVVV